MRARFIVPSSTPIGRTTFRRVATHASGFLGRSQFDSARHRTPHPPVSKRGLDVVWTAMGGQRRVCLRSLMFTLTLKFEWQVDRLVEVDFVPEGAPSEQLFR
jgi:hypothetical protein